jgi:hypothetical protein
MSFRKGQLVEWTDTKTHETERGVYSHTARFGTGFVAAFVRTLSGRNETVAVAQLRPAMDALPTEQWIPAAGVFMRTAPETPETPQDHSEPEREPVPAGFHRHRLDGSLVEDLDTAAGDAEVDRLLEELKEDAT